MKNNPISSAVVCRGEGSQHAPFYENPYQIACARDNGRHLHFAGTMHPRPNPVYGERCR